MKPKLSIILLVASCMLSTLATAADFNISLPTAIREVSVRLKTSDVDYYYLQGTNDSFWSIFVDPSPMKGWEHECYVFYVPKATSGPLSSSDITMTRHMLPPEGNYIPYIPKNRYTSGIDYRPEIPQNTLRNDEQEVAGRTYALILSGGVRPSSNHERYWNDCSFIYQTLVNKYGVPKANIYPVMADGDDPGADMRRSSGVLVSQPLDLDFDGTGDIRLSATKSNVGGALNNLYGRMNQDDHLLFYVIDHGGYDSVQKESYICLWNEGKLYSYELAEMLLPFTEKLVNVNVVLGQCNSGGFVDILSEIGCVVSAACTYDEPSWACQDIPYDEFVYQWTCAVNGADHKNLSQINADSDSNGRVTMLEAFEYAKAIDRQTREHPQYASNPISIGEDLSFDHLAPAVDLYIMDNEEDTGKEPNLTTEIFWKSPSVCVRNQDDQIFEHENPIYTEDHQFAFIYVKVHNRGKTKYPGGKYLHMYWALASTGLTNKAWKGREQYTKKIHGLDISTYPTGGHMDPGRIPPLAPGCDTIVKIKWGLPELMEDFTDEKVHFCLLAKIMDTPYDDGYMDGKLYFDVLASNKQAQKNVYIVRQSILNKPYGVFVRNVKSEENSYSLEFIPRTLEDHHLFNMADIEMKMTSKIYSAWERGGLQSEDLQFMVENNLMQTEENQRVKLLSPNSKLKGLKMGADDFDLVSLNFDFKNPETESRIFTYDLIQKDENGKIIGGETFIIHTPVLLPSRPTITSSPKEGNLFELEVGNVNVEESAFVWENKLGENIGTSRTVTVRPGIEGEDYTVKVYNDNEELGIESIKISSGLGIREITCNGDLINIVFETRSAENSYISLTSAIDVQNSRCERIPEDIETVCLNMSGMVHGPYIVNYIIGESIIDSRKITIK